MTSLSLLIVILIKTTPFAISYFSSKTNTNVPTSLHLIEYKFNILKRRPVPVDPSVLGRLSAEFVPRIEQFVLQSTANNISASQSMFEKRLYNCRREIMVRCGICGSVDGVDIVSVLLIMSRMACPIVGLFVSRMCRSVLIVIIAILVLYIHTCN